MENWRTTPPALHWRGGPSIPGAGKYQKKGRREKARLEGRSPMEGLLVGALRRCNVRRGGGKGKKIREKRCEGGRRGFSLRGKSEGRCLVVSKPLTEQLKMERKLHESSLDISEKKKKRGEMLEKELTGKNLDQRIGTDS